jgi:glycosyltransferase involved in cell wall biosynthesis
MILPTKRRVESLQRFLKSIAVHTDRSDELEIILVIDEDDSESVEFEFPDLRIKKKIVRPGQSMGSLNQAGFEVSGGRYLMLVNDDIQIQTDGWDNTLRSVLDNHRDSVVLAHVNDLRWHHRLCIFPIISRQYCEIAGSICPTGFSRYRIDDHIFSTFRIAAALGVSRIIFFPFIIFSHLNYSMQSGRPAYYSHNPEIEARDEALFQTLYEERLRVAAELCRRAGKAPSNEAILKLKRNRKSLNSALWPSQVYLGRPSLQEFSLVLRAAMQQITLQKIIRIFAKKRTR